MSILRNSSKIIQLKLTEAFIHYNLLSCGFNRWSNVVYCIILDLVCFYTARLIINANN